MSDISWSDDLLTGIAFLDEDHQKLLGMFNALLEAMQQDQGGDSTRERLENLIAAARLHMEQEEGEMRLLNYDKTTAHHAHHIQLLKRLTDLQGSLGTGKNEYPEMFNYVSQWLSEHILVDDMQLAAALKETPP